VAWYPKVIVGAHPYVEEVFQNPRAVERIRELNGSGMEGETLEHLGIPPFSPVAIRKKLTGGEILSLGDREIRVVATPGHTRDSLSFYIPDLELLLPGEAMGVPDLKGRILPEFLRSYPEYEESLKKLLELPVSILGLPHYGVLVGEEVRDYFSRVLSETQSFRDQILSALKKNGWEISRALMELDSALYDPQAIAQPRKPFLINLEAMIRAVHNAYAPSGMV
jgi:glyoxylase-like metal-dependent hydrolase (beta-lactamase superfamily II)